MEKREVSAILEEIGILLELLGENPFKARAYYHAARTIELLDGDLTVLVKEGRLGEVKGIGAALTDKISELVTTGKLAYYENLKATVPPGLLTMLKIPGLGPKKVNALFQHLGVTTLGELEYACLENRLVELPGFGRKSQENILKGIEHMKRYQGQFLFSEVIGEARELLQSLVNSGKVIRASLGGSIRRCKEVVKDIDLLVSAENGGEVMQIFTALPPVQTVLAKGETKASVILRSGINVDLRVVTDAEFPYALHHFTGSKEHNTALRHRAKQMGMKVNEYGLFRGEELIPCRNEEEIFRALGLDFIPPELRENNGEIEAAERHQLPKLVESQSIKGIFHVHTAYSDGTSSLEAMVEAVRKMGLSYVGISDHSQAAYYARGLKEEAIRRQHEEIERLNQRLTEFRVFKGIEVDILPDGSLDYPDEILAKFDFVIASVHSRFHLTEEEMTRRLVRAMENRYVTMLGHPTGRLLLAREAYPVNMVKIIDAAAENGVVIELNASPYRLDLDWRWCKYAKERGVKISINPDAHSPEHLKDIYYGIGIARKGWLEAADIINTMGLSEITDWLGQKRKNHSKKIMPKA